MARRTNRLWLGTFAILVAIGCAGIDAASEVSDNGSQLSGSDAQTSGTADVQLVDAGLPDADADAPEFAPTDAGVFPVNILNTPTISESTPAGPWTGDAGE